MFKKKNQSPPDKWDIHLSLHVLVIAPLDSNARNREHSFGVLSRYISAVAVLSSVRPAER